MPSSSDGAGPASFAGFRAPWWLPGAHLQTVHTAKLTPFRRPGYTRQRWQTPDNDFIDLDWLAPDHPPTGVLVLFHGLEGNSASQYAVAAMRAARRAGWLGCVPHFRGCSGELNLAPRAYHSGDSAEIDWILRRIAAQHPALPRFAAGVSLGGNALLKWAGEQGQAAGRVVSAVAGISAPQDLLASALALNRGFSRLYVHMFMQTLRRKAMLKLTQYPGLYDHRRAQRARDFFTYDDAVTAPMHGFRGCHDYWGRSACKRYLSAIEVPALVVNARNDPFLPARALARPQEVSRQVRLHYPDTGGHVGFVAGRWPGSIDWFGEQLVQWFQHG